MNPTAATARPHRWRRIALIALIVWGLAELSSWLGLLVLREAAGVRYRALSLDALPAEVNAEVDKLLDGQFHYLGLDPELGWTLQPNGRGGLYAANAQGLRAAADYPPVPAAGVLRIATFGDSFTHGDDVAYGDTWQVHLQQQLPNCEVLNFGVPAYGPGQAWLRYQHRGASFAPHIVLVGYMAENIFRSVNVFRPFRSPSYAFPLTKPRYTLRDGQLQLLPNPLPRLDDYRRLQRSPKQVLAQLGEHDAFFTSRYHPGPFDGLPSVRLLKLVSYAVARRTGGGIVGVNGQYNSESEAFRVTEAILKSFCDDVRTDGALPIVLVFPDRIRPRGTGGPQIYQPLVARLRGAGERVIDLQTAFDRHGGEHAIEEFSVGSWGHYSQLAHEIVARFVRDWLVDEQLATPANVAKHR